MLLYEADADGNPVLPHQGGRLGFCVGLDGKLGYLEQQDVQKPAPPANGP